MIPHFLTSSDMHTNTHTVQPTYTLDSTTLHPTPYQTLQHAVLLPDPALSHGYKMQLTPQPMPHVAQWDHLPWDEEFHIEHHRENLRKLDDLLSQLARIAYGR